MNRPNWAVGQRLPAYDQMTPELEAWMKAKSRRTVIARIQKQLHNAHRRGFKRTMIPLADLERLIAE